MSDFIRVGRPGAIGSRKDEVLKNYDKLYGKKNWRLVWDVKGNSVDMNDALALYEDAYFEYFKDHPEELLWIANNFANVYDNNISNVNSGFDYSVQEFGGNHFQDIAIRRVLVRNGLWFKGSELLEIRIKGIGRMYNPGQIKFHKPEIITQPEFKGWWNQKSVESWYQSAKYLEVKDFKHEGENLLYFATSNEGKVNSAKRSLGDLVDLKKVELDISEELDSVEKIAMHKARVAYSVLCKPVICDDSGFVIEGMNGYPGHKVGRELKEKGIKHFLALVKDQPRDAYWIMTLSYMDETLDKPLLFTSKIEGKLIGETRGNPNQEMKSKLWLAFCLNGHEKTLSEMSKEELDKYAVSGRWGEFTRYLNNMKQ